MPAQSDIIAGQVRSKLQKCNWFSRNFGKEILGMAAVDTLLEEIKSKTQDFTDENAPDFKEFIFEEAPQLCTMLIRFGAIELIEQFYQSGIMDSHLPLDARQDIDDPNQMHITHPHTTLKIHDLLLQLLFCSENPMQHQFFVPVLEWNGFNDPCLIGKLPFLIEPVAISRTDFSVVCKTTIHKEHIDISLNDLVSCQAPSSKNAD